MARGRKVERPRSLWLSMQQDNGQSNHDKRVLNQGTLRSPLRDKPQDVNGRFTGYQQAEVRKLSMSPPGTSSVPRSRVSSTAKSVLRNTSNGQSPNESLNKDHLGAPMTRLTSHLSDGSSHENMVSTNKPPSNSGPFPQYLSGRNITAPQKVSTSPAKPNNTQPARAYNNLPRQPAPAGAPYDRSRLGLRTEPEARRFSYSKNGRNSLGQSYDSVGTKNVNGGSKRTVSSVSMTQDQSRLAVRTDPEAQMPPGRDRGHNEERVQQVSTNRVTQVEIPATVELSKEDNPLEAHFER